MTEPVLVADIGGTNARFALADYGSAAPRLRDVQSLPAAAYASLADAAAHYLQHTGARPTRAAIAVASPVDADEIRMTNRAWSFRRGDLQSTLGLDRLLVLNDFGAMAWAIPALAQDDVEHLHGAPTLPPRSPVTVIGPGTGLGVALLVGGDAQGWHVVETEGGHVTFAPLDDGERRIAGHLDALHGRTSTERVLCGDGLARIDAVIREPRTPAGAAPALRDPADVVAQALDGGDADARRALERFCAILGAVCGDAALLHGARSVMLAGGIVPRFVPFLRASAFRERFLAKGRFSAYLEGVAVHVVTHPHPGLLGAAVALHSTMEGPR